MPTAATPISWPRRACALVPSALVPSALALALTAAAARAAPYDAPLADSLSAAVVRITTIAGTLLDQGLENVTVGSGSRAIAFENRRFRHGVEVLARVREAAGGPAQVFERRLGMTAAAIEIGERDRAHPFRVRYPTDRSFPSPPEGMTLSPSFGHTDLDVSPLVDFQIGHIFDPLQLKVDVEPRWRVNPWPGALLRLGLAIPISDDYDRLDRAPDADRVRPGRASFDQLGWLPRAALLSASGGYFGDHRYGFSAGLARPFDQGRWVLDAQIDRTGYVAFAEEGVLYSTLDRTSAFAGVTVRPPIRDFALRVRGARFLYGDRGVEVEARRTMGDFEIAAYGQRSAGFNRYGVRLDLPVPPMVREPGSILRVQPVPRFALDFHDQNALAGKFLTGAASREDYLRQLSRPALEANLDRYHRVLGEKPPARALEPLEWVSLSGMTGFIRTPWAGVMADRGFEFGYNLVPKRWADDHRGSNDNQIYYAAMGFLPRIETSLRWTRIAGYHSFQEIVPDSRLVDMDRMASGRIEILPPALNRPGIAAGIEDAQGTRRFHSTYVVAGAPLAFSGVHGRASLGYGFRALEASRYLLDGAFGAIELSPWRPFRVQVEHDSEKWNAAIGVAPGAGFRIRCALLHLESPSVGAGWSHSL